MNKEKHLNTIVDFFSNIKSERNYKIDEYTVDLYFPEYNLCIECSEYYNRKKEYYILKKLKCTFIYFNPKYTKFNILYIIKEIYLCLIEEERFLLEKLLEELKV